MNIPLKRSNRFLIAGGVISGLISILHVILAFKPELYIYVSPSAGSGLAQQAEQGSSLITIATLAIAFIFAIWAIYAFSAAGVLRRLPLLRTVTIAITVIYILRALFLPTEIKMVMEQRYPFRFVFFSITSLVAGVLYLIGILQQRKFLQPTHIA